MLVLSMNSKRQRRPNVRLGEIGDVPAAFACGFSQKTRENLAHKSYENELLNPDGTEQNHIYGFALENPPEFVVLGPGVSPKISALQENRENNNPNSSKSAFKLVNSDEIVMTKLKLNFGTITKKCRAMKRRGRSTKGANNVFGNVWSSKFSPQFSCEDRKDCSAKELVRFHSDECNDNYLANNNFKDLSDHETPATSKEACEFDVDEPADDRRQQGNSNEFLQEDVCDEENNVSPVSDQVWDETRSGGTDVNIVTRWLEGQGFGKYASVFEMHEVDEEALLLLTLEDLKEMGLFAVGPRRKLYTAIQQLRKGGIST